MKVACSLVSIKTPPGPLIRHLVSQNPPGETETERDRL